MGRIGYFIQVSVLLVFVVGCGGTGRVQEQVARQMLAGDYLAAVATVEGEKDGVYRGKNRLLYFLERGMLLHVTGQFRESNDAFERAKQVGDALYTESLGRLGFSFLTNDYALDYAGENFERTLIHLFAALNYVMLQERDAALVEVRQVGDYLRKLQVDSSNQNVYQEDAFARYLSALLYESVGELNSAFVDYKKAAAAYHEYGSNYSVRLPGSLLPNAERVASALGTWAQDDLRTISQQTQSSNREISPRQLPRGTGEIVLLHYNGLLPIKAQDKFTVPFATAWPLVVALQAGAGGRDRSELNRAIAFSSQISGVDVVSVAFPKFVNRPYSIVRMRPRAANALEISAAELVEDIGAIAEKDLQDRIVRIRTKTIARAAIKFALQKGAEIAAQQASKENGQLLGAATQILGNIARFASEQADQRVWSTLPDQIWMSSIVLPEGTHDIHVDFLGAQQVVHESQLFPGVRVLDGQRQFIMMRTVR